MKLYGLLGNKISYSLSPAMHNAAFAKLKINAEYRLYDIATGLLEGFLHNLLRSGVYGVNVTVPYKMDAYRFVKKYGHIDPDAEMIGAINTIVIMNGTLHGYNTDASGFVKSLKTDLRFDPRMKSVFVFGAGGAGSAVAMKLARAAAKVYVYDIDHGKIKSLAARFARFHGTEKLCVVKHGGAHLKEALDRSDLLVNATPFGRKEGELIVDPSYLHKGLSVYDLIYKPQETPILKAARAQGLKASSGMGMLLYQGAMAFELWTGKKAPVTVMKNALAMALKEKG